MHRARALTLTAAAPLALLATIGSADIVSGADATPAPPSSAAPTTVAATPTVPAPTVPAATTTPVAPTAPAVTTAAAATTASAVPTPAPSANPAYSPIDIGVGAPTPELAASLPPGYEDIPAALTAYGVDAAGSFPLISNALFFSLNRDYDGPTEYPGDDSVTVTYAVSAPETDQQRILDAVAAGLNAAGEYEVGTNQYSGNTRLDPVNRDAGLPSWEIVIMVDPVAFPGAVMVKVSRVYDDQIAAALPMPPAVSTAQSATLSALSSAGLPAPSDFSMMVGFNEISFGGDRSMNETSFIYNVPSDVATAANTVCPALGLTVDATTGEPGCSSAGDVEGPRYLVMFFDNDGATRVDVGVMLPGNGSETLAAP